MAEPKKEKARKGGKFVKGESGNPSGRNQYTSRQIMLQKRFNKGLPLVVDVVEKEALKAEQWACTLYMNKAVPTKSVTPPFEVPDMMACETNAERADMARLLIIRGELSIEHGKILADLFSKAADADVLARIEERLEKLETTE